MDLDLLFYDDKAKLPNDIISSFYLNFDSMPNDNTYTFVLYDGYVLTFTNKYRLINDNIYELDLNGFQINLGLKCHSYYTILKFVVCELDFATKIIIKTSKSYDSFYYNVIPVKNNCWEQIDNCCWGLQKIIYPESELKLRFIKVNTILARNEIQNYVQYLISQDHKDDAEMACPIYNWGDSGPAGIINYINNRCDLTNSNE